MPYGTINADQFTTSDSVTFAGLYGFKNRVINGGFTLAQRGASFVASANNDDTYNLDRWYVLSDGNDIVDITQTTTVPTGAKNSIGLDVETVNKKFGIAQIIENANCFDLIGGSVTLSFQAQVSSTTKLDNVKAAIVAWSGTADTVTSDIISAWNVEGTNPTLIANATYENTPVNLNVTTSWARYSVTATVDTANAANIILFIWSDVTDTTLGDFLYITNVQLEQGSTATSWDIRPITTEIQLAQRYYRKSYALTTNPGTVTNTGAVFTQRYAATLTDYSTYLFPTVMRATPGTITLYSTNTGTASRIYNVSSGADVTPTLLYSSPSSFTISFSATTQQPYGYHFTIDAEL